MKELAYFDADGRRIRVVAFHGDAKTLDTDRLLALGTKLGAMKTMEDRGWFQSHARFFPARYWHCHVAFPRRSEDGATITCAHHSNATGGWEFYQRPANQHWDLTFVFLVQVT